MKSRFNVCWMNKDIIVLVTSGVAAAEGCCSNFQSSAWLVVPLLLSSLAKDGYCYDKYGGIGPDCDQKWI